MFSNAGPMLRLRNVSKEFRRYHREWHRIAGWLGWRIAPAERRRVLHGVSFDVGPGEAVGVVGRNGAGKSTLLKIVTGVLHPSEGAVEYRGRIAAILELGMGFHSDLTGRQNVYHAAGLMGFTSAEIDEKIEAIEEFAEIGNYFDEPMRTYSSGMQMRVAFAVATAWRPDLLIVDEALSVGDTYFQHKSFARIRRFREEGTSLLIVSHDRAAIQAICSRAVLLERGRLIKDGTPEAVMDYYNALIAVEEAEEIHQETEDGYSRTSSGNGAVSLESIGLYDERGTKLEQVAVGTRVTLAIILRVEREIPSLVLGYLIRDRLGLEMFGTNTHYHDRTLETPQVGGRFEFRFTFRVDLGVGSYSVSVAAHDRESHLGDNYFWQDGALMFHVVNLNRKEFVGMVWMEPEIEVHRVR